MYKILTSNRFDKKLKKRISQNVNERSRLLNFLTKLSTNPFDKTLNIHKLQGKLSNLYSYSCGYDCRIIFSIEQNSTGERYILLIDIGTHDEVY